MRSHIGEDVDNSRCPEYGRKHTCELSMDGRQFYLIVA